MNLNLVIASRQSPLAIWQTEFVKQQLLELSKNLDISLDVDILGLSTQGDEILDQHLSKIGGKGLFTKALEEAIYQKKAHCAVHSLKDMPMELPAYEQSFKIAAVLERHNPCDAFISRYSHQPKLADMPKGSKIGTSSVRRTAFLKKYYPDLDAVLLRGNINTRLAKLESGLYDGIILAAAGLERLGLETHITEYLNPAIFLPAPTQGTLAIEVYGDEYLSLFTHLNHYPTFLAALAERQVSRLLGGSCHVPLAAYANWEEADADILNITAALFQGEVYHQVSFKQRIEHAIYQSQSTQAQAIELAEALGKKAADALKAYFK